MNGLPRLHFVLRPEGPWVLPEKLRKITALFEGAATSTEREAATAAFDRRPLLAVKAAVKTQPPIETRFSVVDQWQRRLFTALCRRYELQPYRCKGPALHDGDGARRTALCGQRTLVGKPRVAGGTALSNLNETTELIIRRRSKGT